MKRKSMKLVILMAAVMAFVQPQACMITHASEADVAYTSGKEYVTRSDIIVWRYKIIDGKLYKRQYNTTKGIWIGEWTLV